MKNLFIFLVFTTFIACNEPVATKPKAPETDPYLAAEHQMGNAKIGMLKADLLKFYPNLKEDTLAMEGELPAWTIADTDGKILFWAAHEEGDSITFLISENPKMHTAEGIKVGSSYADLQKIFPDLTISFVEGLRAYSKAKSMAFGIMGDVETKEKADGEMRIVKVKEGAVQTLEFQ